VFSREITYPKSKYAVQNHEQVLGRDSDVFSREITYPKRNSFSKYTYISLYIYIYIYIYIEHILHTL
jgi:hypothetical protein